MYFSPFPFLLKERAVGVVVSSSVPLYSDSERSIFHVIIRKGVENKIISYKVMVYSEYSVLASLSPKEYCRVGKSVPGFCWGGEG